jgi:hypothetical protein
VRTFRAHHSSAFVVPFGVFVGFAALTYTAAGGGTVGASVEVSRDGASARPLPERPVNRADTRARLDTAYGRLPLGFEENRGQADPRVRFLSHGHGYRVFVATTETVLILQRPKGDDGSAENRHSDARAASGPTQTAVTMRLVGANADAPSGGLEELPGKVNYFIGNDPTRWRTDVPTYARVMTRNVYPGIDIIHRGHQRELEYDFVVAPGADPADIRVSFSGIQKMHLDSNGDLVLATDAGEMRQHTPYLYQDRGGVRDAVAGGYVLKGDHEIGFTVGPYDAALPLVLDPVLAYSSYLGGTTNDEARAIAVDAGGNAYIAGVTSSSSTTTFPRTGGIPTVVGGLDAFVSKLNAAGDSLVYSTFIGHSQSESAEAVAVDDNGHAYVAGYTRSPGFPTTPGGYQLSINTGNYSAFVTRLNADGNGLVYSTFLGGNIASTPGTNPLQEALGIAVDGAGNAYVTGWTQAVNFPQFHAYQASNGGQIDAFVTKLNTTASGAASLVYSTYLGGGGLDHGVDIAVDETGHAFVTGRTDSGGSTAPFPTMNPFQPTLAGAVDAFVAKLDTAVSGVSSLVYSTYLGGSRTENPNTPYPGGIAVDSTGNAYVTGSTNSWSSAAIPFPTTPTSYQPATVGVGDLDVFLTKLNPAGTAILYSTFLGGIDNDVGRSVAVDSAGHAYVAGEVAAASSGDFPGRDAVQPTFGGGTIDAFVVKFDTGATGDASLVYSTFFGGSNNDLAFGIAIDSAGSAYVAGKTNSSGLATSGAFQAGLGGASDAFVAKLEETPGVSLVSLTLNPETVTGSKPAKATIAISNPAPPGGIVVTLSSSDTTVATVPATTTIAEGLTSRVVTVTTKVVTTSTTVDISASYDGVTRTRTLTVVAPALKSLSLSPSTFPGGCGQSVGKVTLTAKAPTGGLVVSLTDTNPVATVPASVTVPSGAVSATFSITAPAVSSSQTGNVTATLDGISKSKEVTVRPIGVQLLNLTPNPVVGPNTVTGTVTLECKAAPGSIVVTLSSNNPAVAAPTTSSITIPFDSMTGTFTVTTADVSVVSSAVIKAMAGGVTKSRTLTVNP